MDPIVSNDLAEKKKSMYVLLFCQHLRVNDKSNIKN